MPKTAGHDYEKIVKLACKPKNAPPKAKYLDALIAATYSDDAPLHEITRALAERLRDNNPVIVFKALLTLHQMIRAGSTDVLLRHLATTSVLRLSSVSDQNFEGYRPPGSLRAYAGYLDARIRAFKDRKHDMVSLQNESNKRSTGLSASSKARHLRHLPVEKGLLREVAQIQTILNALIRCKFYDDDLRDENTVLAYRLLVKDLLVLFQAGNEGVCNILEHYFEMSKIDATESFEIYKSFINQTDKIVDYLAIARRLNNIVNVPVPNLKHAPTSLVKALDEYLNDPNFEQNRAEYKKSLGVVEGRKDGASGAASAAKATAKTEDTPAASSSNAAASSSTGTAPAAQQKIQDFLDSIQPEAQPTIFGGPAAAPAGVNPLLLQQQQFQQQQFQQQQLQQQQMAQFGMLQQPTGQFGFVGTAPLQAQTTGHNPFRQSTMFAQPTGFVQPQATGFPQQQQQFASPFMQPQATGFLQPAPTGAFPQQPQRQSTFPLAGPQLAAIGEAGPFGQLQQQPTGFLQPQTTGGNPFRQNSISAGSTLNRQPTLSVQTNFSAQGPASAPLTQPAAPFAQQFTSTPSPVQDSSRSTPQKATSLLQPQATGSRNPFAPPGGIPKPAPPPQPKAPSMNELAQHQWNQQFAQAGGLTPTAPTGAAPAAQPTAPTADLWDPFAPVGGTAKTNGTSTAMSDIASAFAKPEAPGNDFMSQFGSLSVGGAANGGATSPGALQPQSTGFLQPQRTGFGGSSVKPFKPTSNFGSSLMESLPPLSGEPSPASPNGPLPPAAGAQALAPTGTGGSQGQALFAAFGSASTPTGTAPAAGAPFAAAPGSITPQRTGFQPTSSFGQSLLSSQPQPAPLQAQNTGSNPFRQSIQVGAAGTGAPGAPGGAAPFGAFPQSGPFGANSPFAGQNQAGAFQPQRQQSSLF
ncbi:hypothetical protein Q8F55_008873 [Vanrija albida]|uniref:ENTH domain-containing protein n=1 Tax=Vanrija albida TaxID=181172 RepID=A0ABR3PSY9_9TREE